jgi:hypothetical protein
MLVKTHKRQFEERSKITITNAKEKGSNSAILLYHIQTIGRK